MRVPGGRVAVVLVALAFVVPAPLGAASAAEGADAALRFYFHDRQDLPAGRFLDVHNTPGDRVDNGPAAFTPVALMAEERAGASVIGANYAYEAAGADVPSTPLLDGVARATLYVKAKVKANEVNEGDGPIEVAQQSVGAVELRLTLRAGDVVLGDATASHVFAGEEGWVPFRYEFPVVASPGTARDVVAVLGFETGLAGSIALGMEGEAASYVEIPSAAVVLDATIAPPARVMEDLPAAFRVDVRGGVSPFAFVWDFGDGGVSSAAAPAPRWASPGLRDVSVAVTDATGATVRDSVSVRVYQRDFVDDPRVVVAVLDSGINPYHEHFRRDGIELPLEDLRDARSGLLPRVVPLTFGGDYASNLAADAEAWSSIAMGELVHFAGTNVLAIDWYARDTTAEDVERGVDRQLGVEDQPEPAVRVLDDDGHGTAVAGTVVTESPDALVLMVRVAGELTAADAAAAYAWAAEQPWIDVISTSLGIHANAPVAPAAYAIPAAQRDAWLAGKLAVASAGNDPSPLPTDAFDGAPWVVSVTGSQVRGEAREVLAATAYPDVASSFTVRAPSHRDVSALRGWSGTSFSGPTVAGTLAAAVHELRRESGWSGGIADGFLDPIAGIDNARVRDALNASALYVEYDGYAAGIHANVDVAVLPVAPFAEIGWGHVDARIVGDLVAAARAGASGAEAKPEAGIYMGAMHEARRAYWNDAFVSTLAAAGEAAS